MEVDSWLQASACGPTAGLLSDSTPAKRMRNKRPPLLKQGSLKMGEGLAFPRAGKAQSLPFGTRVVVRIPSSLSV